LIQQRLMDEDNFSNDVNGILDQYKAMAANACGSGTCEFALDSGWDPTLATSYENPVKEDYAGMGQVQLNVSGRITVTHGADGSLSTMGAYKMSIFKAWNFDVGEYPSPHGVTIRHDFYHLPEWGMAQDFILRGTSSERSF